MSSSTLNQHIYIWKLNWFKQLHLILACDETRESVFSDIPVIGFKNNKNSNLHGMRTLFPDINEVGRWKPCSRKRYLESRKMPILFKIKIQQNLKFIDKTSNCNFKILIYLIECQIYGKQYNNGSIVKKFCARTITVKLQYCSFQKEQKLSNKDYLQSDHNIIWER